MIVVYAHARHTTTQVSFDGDNGSKRRMETSMNAGGREHRGDPIKATGQSFQFRHRYPSCAASRSDQMLNKPRQSPCIVAPVVHGGQSRYSSKQPTIHYRRRS